MTDKGDYVSGRDIASVLNGAAVGRTFEPYYGGNGYHRHRSANDASTEHSSARAYPEPLGAAGYYGLLGDLVREIEPYIEADSSPLLVNLLAFSGNAMGRDSYLQVGATRHRAILNAVTVGMTGDNKTDGVAPIRALAAEAWRAEPPGATLFLPLAPRMANGLSTGEGLLHQVRDERHELRTNAKTHVEEDVLVDRGVLDKRLFVIEPEFARVLSVMGREHNTLSTILRDLFDSPDVAEVNTRTNPLRATKPHISMVGLITPDELNRKLGETELFNGFTNRYVWTVARRIKSLPDPPDYSETAMDHGKRWGEALLNTLNMRAFMRDHAAIAQWKEVYEQLRRGEWDGAPTRQGLALDACARAHVMVARIAMIFAALDGTTTITVAHQTAALEVWAYGERCAAYLFGELAADPVENVIAAALQRQGSMTRDALRGLFSRHLESSALQMALEKLVADGKARRTKTPSGGGRPVEQWEWTAED